MSEDFESMYEQACIKIGKMTGQCQALKKNIENLEAEIKALKSAE